MDLTKIRLAQLQDDPILLGIILCLADEAAKATNHIICEFGRYGHRKLLEASGNTMGEIDAAHQYAYEAVQESGSDHHIACIKHLYHRMKEEFGWTLVQSKRFYDEYRKHN
jgi:hypothetical protein